MNTRQAYKILYGKGWRMQYKVSTVKKAYKAIKCKTYADFREHILIRIIGRGLE
jgi:hypothetical protein